jgi:class 3 adenylate cyclase
VAVLPKSVGEFLFARALDETAPAYLRLDADGRVVGIGGVAERFGLDPSLVGADATGRIDALVGLLPPGDEPVTVPTVAVADDVYADVHAFRDADAVWVVFVDRTAWVAERRMAQQLSNDMSLLRDALDRRTDATGAAAWQEDFVVAAEGERRAASVLTTILGGLGLAGDERAPDEAIRAAGLFARAIGRVVVDEAGVVASQCGERTTAIFGVRATTVATATLALTAALRGAAAANELNAAARRGDGREVSVRIGIASGEAAFGALGGQLARQLGAVGSCVERAPRLAAATPDGTIAIDTATFDALGDGRARFRSGPADRGPEGVTPTYLTEAR